jgi:hypothetical protein
MSAILSISVARISAIIAFALLTAAVVSFPTMPTTGAGFSSTRPVVVVNRALKGDRLAIANPAASSQDVETPFPAVTPRKIPAGCDHAFSPMSAPPLAEQFFRCMT